MQEALQVYNQGVDCMDRDDFDQAIAAFSEAIRISPELAAAYNGRGVTYAISGSPKRAIDDMCEAIRLDPAEPKFYRARGIVYTEMGQGDMAAADFAQAEQLETAPTV